MGYFLWFGFAIAVAIWASNRGRHGFVWFLIACCISPLLAAVFIAVLANKSEASITVSEESYVRCTQCAEFVLPQAVKCKHCGSALMPDLNFNKNLADKKKEDSKNLIIGILFIASLIVIGNVINYISKLI